MRWGFTAVLLVALSGCHVYHQDADGRLFRWVEESDIQLVSAQQPIEQPVKEPKQKTMMDLLKLPGNIPGANAPDIKMPAATAPRKEIEAAIKQQFPPLPRLPKLPQAVPGPAGEPLTLEELQQTALRASPLIQQAHWNVDSARGLAVQAGLYPNPVVGFEGSTMGQGTSANDSGALTGGQQGGYFEQTIKTAGKLGLARSAGAKDVQIAEQRLRQAEADLQAEVRRGYFAVLSARTHFEVIRSLAQSTDELYNVLLLQMQAGEVAAYEPMQIRVLALQARGQLVLAHNRYVAAWKQLAAVLSHPSLPLTEVAGRLDMPVPAFDYDGVLAYVLNNHTDMLSARIGVDKYQLLVRLAEVQPIPDIALHVAVQKDYTTPPFGAVANVVVGVPLPLWDRNQGNIQHVRALLRHALEESDRVRNDLSSRTAEVFERYENNRALLDLYKKQILPNQVQAFRAAVARHAAIGDKSVNYNDLVTAQQSLANMINNYLNALGDQWASVVDIAHLLQTTDLLQVERTEQVAPIPNLPPIIKE